MGARHDTVKRSLRIPIEFLVAHLTVVFDLDVAPSFPSLTTALETFNRDDSFAYDGPVGRRDSKFAAGIIPSFIPASGSGNPLAVRQCTL